MTTIGIRSKHASSCSLAADRKLGGASDNETSLEMNPGWIVTKSIADRWIALQNLELD